MHVVATEAGDPPPVHHALHEVIPLHAILMRCAVRKVRKGQLPQTVLLQLPEILQMQPRAKADGPIIVFSLDRTAWRASLRMALNTSVVGPHVIHTRGIQGVSARRMLHVLASRPVAPFATYVPLRYLFGVDVVIDGVAAVACRTRGPLHIVRRIKRRPPVGPIRHEIWPPNPVGDIPLRRLRKIIIAPFREVTLFPNAAVN